MKRTLTAIIIFVAFFETSCQKKLSAVNVSNGTDTTIGTGNLVIKTIKISRTSYTDVNLSNTNYTDSLITEYTYDSENRLAGTMQYSWACDSVSNTGNAGFYFNVYRRDAPGRVVKWLFGGGDAGTTNITDTPFVEYHYIDSTSPLLAYEKPEGGDSNVYVRNITGQVERIDKYGTEYGSMMATGHQTFTYDGNDNATQISIYGFSDGNGFHPDSLAFTYSYQYDNKVNPLYTGDDMMPEWLWVDPAKMHNNATLYTQQTNADKPAGTGPVQSDTRTYEYRADGRPVTCTQSIYLTPDVGPHTICKTSYFYN